MAVRLHDEDPALLREAIQFTYVETGFIPRLIEKDYFCSVVLEYLAASGAGLLFKGGTCLSKVHSRFYRLSEDLDFSIPTAPGSSRADRSRSVKPLRAAVDELPDRLPGFRSVEPLSGANNSTQYNAVVGYASRLDGHIEPVGIEVGLREPRMMDTHEGAARTALLNPLDGQALVDAFVVPCLAYSEVMAEKVRAALCRREVAIRDFFDVDHAVRHTGFKALEPAFLELVGRKIAVSGTGPPDVSAGRMQPLQRQLDTQLRPVLGEPAFAEFDLARAIATVLAVEQELARRR